jgi:hypothetical protein
MTNGNYFRHSMKIPTGFCKTVKILSQVVEKLHENKISGNVHKFTYFLVVEQISLEWSFECRLNKHICIIIMYY